MQFMEHSAEGQYEIRSVQPGLVRVEEHELTWSFLISPERLMPEWPPRSLEELNDDHLEQVLALEPEVVLLGTGESIRFPEPRIFAMFQSRGIGFEVMDSNAACRTYNVLVSEERRAVGAIML